MTSYRRRQTRLPLLITAILIESAVILFAGRSLYRTWSVSTANAFENEISGMAGGSGEDPTVVSPHAPVLANDDRGLVTATRSFAPPESLEGPEDYDKYVLNLAKDSTGRIWVGTENEGVWCFDPNAEPSKQWHGYAVKDGLGDNCVYALAVDAEGRIWVGHLNHGVSVYNGERWKNYDILHGPLGDRVFAIACDPLSGDVWISTNAGITRYHDRSGAWSYLTETNGLPSDQISSMAFAADGTLYLGTQQKGIAIGHPHDDYRSWMTIRAPAVLPKANKGSGIPSDLINQIFVAHDGAVYAATTNGLTKSVDGGRSWSYFRGRDWLSKTNQLRGRVPKALQRRDESASLIQDYATCLAESVTGDLWVGTRQRGYELMDPVTGVRMKEVRSRNTWTSAIVPRPGKGPLIGEYRGGVVESLIGGIDDSPSASAAMPLSVAGVPTPSLPVEAGIPTREELSSMLNSLFAEPAQHNAAAPRVRRLASDWKTQGAWLGRYGRSWICLASCVSPSDFIWGPDAEQVHYSAQIGPNHDAGDSLRHWVSPAKTDDVRVLELPTAYLDSRIAQRLATAAYSRRQAEWDDHGEDYPLDMAGPDIYCTLTIPNGPHRLSLYQVNYDAHLVSHNHNRVRDYLISVREHPAGAALSDVRSFEAQPELASARVHDFWGGVYTRFLVEGPRELTIRVERNYSLNTVVNAVMLDPLDEYPEPYYATTTRGAVSSAFSASLGSDAALANAVVGKLQALQNADPFQKAIHARLFYARLACWYKAGISIHNDDPSTNELRRNLATCLYQLGLYEEWERVQHEIGAATPRDVELALHWDGQQGSSPDECKAAILAWRKSHPENDVTTAIHSQTDEPG